LYHSIETDNMRSTLKFGLITGAISVVWLFGSFTLVTWLNGKYDWDVQVSTIRGIGGLLSIPIQAIGIYLAMQNVKQLTGSLTYGQAVKTGLIVAATIAIIVAIFSLLYCTIINPGYAEFMVHDTQKAMIAKVESQQDISQASVAVRREFSPGMQVMQALVGQFVTGAIMSLIIGLFIKSKK
jgi:hypothetical protein